MTEKTTSRRDRRIAARKQQILDAAAEVFAEKGFQRATTKEIADAADIAEGTIYNYFPSKEALLMELMVEIGALDERREAYKTGLSMELHDFFETYFLKRVHEVGSNYRVFVAVLPEILNSPELREQYQAGFMAPVLEMLDEHLQKRRELGQLDVENIPLFTRMAAATILGLQVLMRLGDPVVEAAWQNPEELGQMMAHLFLPPTKPHKHE